MNPTVVIDGVKYVPEHPETNELTLEMVNGDTLKAENTGNRITLSLADEPLIHILQKGEAFIFSANKWAQLNIQGNSDTTTRRTIKAIAKQVGLNVGDEGETEKLKQRIKEPEFRLEKAYTPFPIKVRVGARITAPSAFETLHGYNVEAGRTYTVEADDESRTPYRLGSSEDNLWITEEELKHFTLEHSTPITPSNIHSIKPGAKLTYNGNSTDKYLNDFKAGTVTVTSVDNDDNALKITQQHGPTWWIHNTEAYQHLTQQ